MKRLNNYTLNVKKMCIKIELFEKETIILS